MEDTGASGHTKGNQSWRNGPPPAGQEKGVQKNKFFCYQKERIIKCQQVSWPEVDVKSLRPFYVKHLILIKVRTADPRKTLYSSLYVTKGI